MLAGGLDSGSTLAPCCKGPRGASGGPDGRGGGDAGGLKPLPERALDRAPDHVVPLVDGDRRLLQVIKIANNVGPLERPASFLEAALEGLAQHPGQERAEHMAANRLILPR